MFESLEQHKKILVTGPHRSGTTFAATAIQHDLRDSHGLIREELCRKSNFDIGKARYWLMEYPGAVVVQAPFLADMCHQFPGVFVVFLHRDNVDIARSQQRMYEINGQQVIWPYIEDAELSKYHANGAIALIKYESWQEQKKSIDHYLELDYESLRAHPLWVDDRKDFHVRQTSAVA